MVGIKGAPGEARTPNPWFRRPMLYPIELRAQHLIDVVKRLSRLFERCQTASLRQNGAIALA